MNLNQVTIPSKDVGAAMLFYQKLGLKLIVDALPRYVRFECPNGEATFSIHEVNALAVGEGVTVYFEVDHLDAKVNALQREGIVFDMEPKDQMWLWREAHLRDLDGNRLILFHAGANRKNPPWRVDDKNLE